MLRTKDESTTSPLPQSPARIPATTRSAGSPRQTLDRGAASASFASPAIVVSSSSSLARSAENLEYTRRLSVFVAYTFAEEQSTMDDVWHILTATPSKVGDKCDELGHLLQNSKEYLLNLEAEQYEERKQAKEARYEGLAGLVYNLLMDKSGMYCYMTRGNSDMLREYSRHVVQGTITEKTLDMKIAGKDHDKKISEMSRRIDNVVADLKWVEACNEHALRRKGPIGEVAKPANLTKLLAEINSMKLYLQLHKRCIKAALEYDISKTQGVSVPSIGKTQNRFILELHPHDVKELTPLQATPSTRALFTAHTERTSKPFAKRLQLAEEEPASTSLMGPPSSSSSAASRDNSELSGSSLFVLPMLPNNRAATGDYSLTPSRLTMSFNASLLNTPGISAAFASTRLEDTVEGAQTDQVRACRHAKKLSFE